MITSTQHKEFRFNCGNYRHFIVDADNVEQARARFIAASKDYFQTRGFTIKDVTSVEEVK